MAASHWSRTLRDYNFPPSWKQKEQEMGKAINPQIMPPVNCFLLGRFYILKVPQPPQPIPPRWEGLIKYMRPFGTFLKQAQ